MENNYEQVIIEIPNSILLQLNNICDCANLQQNPNSLVMECLKYTAKNASSFPSIDWQEDGDSYEELVGSLDFDNI
ncbi:MAG: hypothetical protein SCK28_04960 [Bacillota bacterium]|nr:hypothetical protein [Bacillota bacterium]